MTHRNAFDQAVGAPMPDWQGATPVTPLTLQGRYTRLEPLEPARHADDLVAAFASAPDGRDWTYMLAGPFEQEAALRDYLRQISQSRDTWHFAVFDMARERFIGTLALMRCDAANGVIEVGHVSFAPLLKRSRVATEAVHLLAAHVFERLGYRRFEWKCDAFNAPSRSAALRFGFSYEGTFRQVLVYKGRTRDTAWFSMLDSEWPQRAAAQRRWLAPENFDADGQQRARLTDLPHAMGSSEPV